MRSTSGLLQEEEELLAEVRPHPVVLLGPVLLFLAAIVGAATIAIRYPGAPIVVAWLLAAMVAVPALWAGVRFLRWRSIRFAVTTTRLLYRRGVLGRDVVQLRLQRVAEVHCSQSVGGRLIGSGRLVFEVAGGDGPLVVHDVRWPRRLQRVITAQLDRLDVPYGGRYDPSGGYGARGGYGASDYGDYAAPTQAVPSGVRRSWDPTDPVGRSRNRRSSTDTPPHGLAVEDDQSAGTVPGQILQLDELRRRGILTDDEFAAKKAELLGRI